MPTRSVPSIRRILLSTVALCATGSVDPGKAAGFSTHGIVNGSGRFHLENLADRSRLPESGAYLIVAPIKIDGGSGGHVLVFAVVP